MKKLLLGLILVLIFPLSAHGAVYLHGEEIPTVFMNNQNYISRNQLGLFNMRILHNSVFLEVSAVNTSLNIH